MDTKAKVIFVNSFKGGAGKTTLALTHCIDNLFHKKEEQYENIIYIDLDVLGTGTCYLFKEGLLTEEKCFEKTEKAVEVQLELENSKGSLYVAYLNPATKSRSVYGGKRYINHQSVMEQTLKNSVLDYIEKQIKQVPSTLIVLDCAPGFTNMEQAILQQCYQMMISGKLDIEEDYLTTLDSSHVQKCIQCFNDGLVGIPIERKYRNINIIINDVQNYSGYLEKEKQEKVEENWERIVSKMLCELKDKDIVVRRWKYSKDIAIQSVYGIEGAVENYPDSYIFTDDNYRILYSKDNRKPWAEK